jgi:hypothetical protein
MDFYFGIAAFVLSIKGLGGSFNALCRHLGLSLYHGPLVGSFIGILLLGFFLLSSQQKPDLAGEPKRPAPISLAAFLLIFFAMVYWGMHERIQLIQTLPIDIKRADMLPNLLAGLADVAQGRNPYHAHVFADRVIPHFYLPVLWISYLPFYMAGVDVRWLNILSQLIIFLGLLYAFLRRGSYRNWSFEASGLLFLVIIAVSVFSKQFSREVVDLHTGPFWLFYSLLLMSFCGGWNKTTFILIPLVVLCRETAILFVLPFFAFLFRFHRARFYEALFWSFGIGLAIAGPFVLLSPGGFFAGVKFYSNHVYAAPWQDMVAHFGLCGVIKKQGLIFLQKPLQWSGLVASLLLAFRIKSRNAISYMALGGVAYIPFILLVSITWAYMFTEPLILAVFLLQREGIEEKGFVLLKPRSPRLKQAYN